MKKLLGILVLTLLLITPSQADDIRDFQIEGLSVGDSLLDHFTEAQIKQEEQNAFFYKDKKFIIIWNPSKKLDVYDTSSIVYKYKPRDKKYIIYGVDGALKFPNNLKGCKKKIKEIENELDIMFKDTSIERKNRTLNYASGTIKTYGTYYTLKSGDYVDLYCEEVLKNSSKNILVVLIGSKEYAKYLSNISNADR